MIQRRASSAWLGAALVLALAAPAAHAQKVYVDYDGATAFSQLRTFQLVETNEDLRDFSNVLHGKVFSTIARYLSEGGMTRVEQDPDVYVAYFTADRGHLRLILDDLDYTYGDSFEHGEYWEGGVGTRTPDTFTFEEGTLVIDVWEAETKRLIWRGIATAALGKTTDKNVGKLEKALKKIFERWEKEYGGSARRLRLYQEAQDDGGR
jgi:hypothetical protein